MQTALRQQPTWHPVAPQRNPHGLGHGRATPGAGRPLCTRPCAFQIDRRCDGNGPRFLLACPPLGDSSRPPPACHLPRVQAPFPCTNPHVLPLSTTLPLSATPLSATHAAHPAPFTTGTTWSYSGSGSRSKRRCWRRCRPAWSGAGCWRCRACSTWRQSWRLPLASWWYSPSTPGGGRQARTHAGCSSWFSALAERRLGLGRRGGEAAMPPGLGSPKCLRATTGVRLAGCLLAVNWLPTITAHCPPACLPAGAAASARMCCGSWTACARSRGSSARASSSCSTTCRCVGGWVAGWVGGRAGISLKSMMRAQSHAQPCQLQPAERKHKRHCNCPSASANMRPSSTAAPARPPALPRAAFPSPLPPLCRMPLTGPLTSAACTVSGPPRASSSSSMCAPVLPPACIGIPISCLPCPDCPFACLPACILLSCLPCPDCPFACLLACFCGPAPAV